MTRCGLRPVSSRVPGVVRQHSGIDADLAQRAGVFFLDIAAEDQILVGIAMQPAIALDFVLQLPRRPAGITECQDGVLRPRAPGDRLQNIDGRGQANPFVDVQRRVQSERDRGQAELAAACLVTQLQRNVLFAESGACERRGR